MEEKTVEQSFEKLEEIISKMEASDVSLSDSFALYKSGIEELQFCSNMIEQTKKAVVAIQQDGSTTVFDED